MSLNPTVKIPLGIVGPLVAAALAVGGSLIASKVSAARDEERIANQASLLQETRQGVKILQSAQEQQTVHLQAVDDKLQHLQDIMERLEDYMHMRPPPPRGWENRDPPP